MKKSELIGLTPETNSYVIVIVLGLLVCYLPFLFVSDNGMIWLADEDGIFEYAGAMLFLMSGVVCGQLFFRTRNGWFILMSLFFLVTGGEEISWGQRLFGFATPSYMMENNVQHEFNLHNIEIFNEHDFRHDLKTGLSKYMTANFLFKLIGIVYGFVMPVSVYFFDGIRKLVEKVKLPLPVFSMGVFLTINWVVFYGCKYFLSNPEKSQSYHYTFSEVFETCAAFVFFIIVFYFKRSGVKESMRL